MKLTDHLGKIVLGANYFYEQFPPRLLVASPWGKLN